MTDRPIIFNAPMIRALIAGRKTMTRRMLKPQPSSLISYGYLRKSDKIWHWEPRGGRPSCDWWGWPPYISITDAIAVDHVGVAKGDRLWVRETFVLENTIKYHELAELPKDGRPFISYYSPEWGSYFLIPHYRATEQEPNIVPLENVDLGDDRTKWSSAIHMPRWASRITLEVTGVKVERLQDISEEDAIAEGCHAGAAPQSEFADLWDRIYGPGAWEKNPWVYCLEFKTRGQ